MGALILAASPWLFFGGLNAADLASTAYGEHHAGREGNPIMGTAWPRRVAVKGAETALEAWGDRRLSRRGRIVLRVAVGALRVAIVVHNVRQHR